jgi:hypothetical protein
MRKTFPGYYRPTSDEFTELWQECVFTFDANVLLNIYRYTPNTQERFFEILEELKDRIWVPHQAALEFHRNRLGVISDQVDGFNKITEILEANINQLRNQLGRHQRHKSINIEEILKQFEKAVRRARKYLENQRTSHPDLLSEDSLLERITNLFENKVGEPFLEKELEDLYKEAEKRFKQSTPPGFMDANKEKNRATSTSTEQENDQIRTKQFGDVVIWFQLIKYAQLTKLPLILVTDDGKPDWWLIHKGKTIGPRPELIQEMAQKANVPFYLYSPEEFNKYAQVFLNLEEQPDVIEEIRELREADDATRESHRQLLNNLLAISPSNAVTLEGLYNTQPNRAYVINPNTNSITLDPQASGYGPRGIRLGIPDGFSVHPGIGIATFGDHRDDPSIWASSARPLQFASEYAPVTVNFESNPNIPTNIQAVPVLNESVNQTTKSEPKRSRKKAKRKKN